MVDPAAQLAELEALRRRADTEVLTDPARLARYLDGDYVVRPHVRYIAQQLAALASGETKRLMVQVPPQTGKSMLCAVNFPFWWLIKNPRSRVVIGSYAQQLAASRGKAIRRLVNTHGHRWGMQLAHASGQVAEWELDTGGGIKSVGVGAGVTGFPADLLRGHHR